VKRHLARGRRDIDARLDLHGLRQQTAYSTLKHFLAQAQAKGYRHVLIITGKGGPGVNDEDRDFWLPEERGVLRRLVPHWLSEAAFRPYVVTFTESAAQHGGSGALYITLRKSQTSRLRPR
jgi:DNA-nicking Smr family endonuclease